MDRSVSRPSASSSGEAVDGLDVAEMVLSTSPSTPPIAMVVVVVVPAHDEDDLDERASRDDGKDDSRRGW
jgi:hypothetical protein